MATPEWTGYASQSLTNPSSSLTDFTLLVDLSDMPADWWSHADTEDGTRGRAFKSTGEELPCDWINYDLQERTGVLAVKWLGSMASSGTQTLHVYPPSKTNAVRGKRHEYGQHNAYDAHTAWFATDCKSDRTRNSGTDLTENGSVTVGEAAGVIGDGATEFDGTDDRLTLGNFLGEEFSMTLSCYFLQDDTADTSLMRLDDGNTTNYFRMYSSTALSASTKYSGGSIYTDTTGTVSASTWYHGAAVLDGTNVTAVFNGTAGSGTAHSGTFPDVSSFTIGAYTNITVYHDGKIQHAKISTTARATAWLDQEADMRTQSTFWGTWTWNSHSDPSYPAGDYVSATAANPDTGLEDFSLLVDVDDFPADFFTEGDTEDGTRGRVYKELATGDTDFAVSPIPPPDSDLTDFSLLIDLSKLPGRWWDQVTETTDATKGRAYKDDTAATELACDWIDVDFTNHTGLLRVKWSGTLSAAGNQAVRIYPPLSGNSTVAASATYGSDNAYASHWAGYWPMTADANDRTSNGLDLTNSGSSVTVGGVSGRFGNATDFDGIVGGYESTTNLPTGDTPLTMLAWQNGREGTVISFGHDGNPSEYWAMSNSLSGSRRAACTASSTAGGNDNSLVLSASIPDKGIWWHEAAVFASDTSRTAFQNGTAGTEDTATNAPNPDPNTPTVGIGWNVRFDSSDYDGAIHDAQLHTVALSDDWIAYEYSQGDQETFWGWRVPMTAVEVPADWIEYSDSGTSGLLRCRWDHVLGAEGTQKLRVYPPDTTRRPRFRSDAYGRYDAYRTACIGYFPLFDTDDRTRLRRDLVLNGNAHLQAGTCPVGGELDIDGTGDNATNANTTPTSVFTDMAWYKATWSFWDGPTNHLRNYAGGGTLNNDFVAMNATSTLRVGADDGTHGAGNNAAWNFAGGSLAVQGSGSVLRINGTEYTTTAGTAPPTEHDKAMVIGSGQATQDYATGLIGPVMRFNEALGADWIEHEYDQSNANATFWGTWDWSGGGGGDALTAQDIVAGAPAVDSPTLGQSNVLTAQDIVAGAPAVDSPTLGQSNVLTAQDVAAGAPAVDSATLGQSHALLSQEIAAGSPAVDSATLGQSSVLTAQDIAAGAPAVDSATLGQTHVLTSQEIAAGAPAVDAATLGQTHVLTSQEIAAGTPEIDQASMTGASILTAQDIAAGSPAVDTPTLGQAHVLTSQEIAAGTPAVDVATIGQTHVLTSQEIATGAPAVDQATISQAIILTAQDIVSGVPVIDQPTLTDFLVQYYVGTRISLTGSSQERLSLGGTTSERIRLKGTPRQ